jgi:hypothetical protein
LLEGGLRIVDPNYIVRVAGADRQNWMQGRDLTIEALQEYCDYVLLIDSQEESDPIGYSVTLRMIRTENGEVVAGASTERWKDLIVGRTSRTVAGDDGYEVIETEEIATTRDIIRLLCAEIYQGLARSLEEG